MSDENKAADQQVRELAEVISTQAQAIAEGRLVGPLSMAVDRLVGNVSTLRAWVPKP